MKHYVKIKTNVIEKCRESCRKVLSKDTKTYELKLKYL